MVRSENVVLLGVVLPLGGFMLALMKFFYGTIRERIEELKADRDYYRDRYLGKSVPEWEDPEP